MRAALFLRHECYHSATIAIICYHTLHYDTLKNMKTRKERSTVTKCHINISSDVETRKRFYAVCEDLAKKIPMEGAKVSQADALRYLVQLHEKHWEK